MNVQLGETRVVGNDLFFTTGVLNREDAAPTCIVIVRGQYAGKTVVSIFMPHCKPEEICHDAVSSSVFGALKLFDVWATTIVYCTELPDLAAAVAAFHSHCGILKVRDYAMKSAS
ncbi:MAG: hypothetical protein LBB38_04385 [Puniceicoccales bacterium]|jgi:hypothetical protein|nr:hypothetical protein [Puniceicoccales bacterium]